MTQNIIIINGPNLNLLGKREESQYGNDTYSDLEKKCNEYAKNKDINWILKIPTIELHISNIYSREEFRQKSLISKAVNGIICGLGTDGYTMAIDAIIKLIKNK